MNHETLLCATLIVNVPRCVPLSPGVGARDDVTLDPTESHLKKTDRCIAVGSVANPQRPVTLCKTAYFMKVLGLKAQKTTYAQVVFAQYFDATQNTRKNNHKFR